MGATLAATGSAQAADFTIAWRRLPAPESLRFVTVDPELGGDGSRRL
jgi:hypothetical protein